MLIFALDSTAIIASVALLRDGKPLASFHVENGNTHSETLLPMAKALLESAGVGVDDIDLFACSTGPGSFTGVRIGVATVKGLAFGKNKPCVAVSSLEALAQSLVPSSGILCPVMNARRGQVYNALFEVKDGELCRLTEDRALAIEELEAELSSLQRPFYLCGDGAELVRRHLRAVTPSPTPPLLVGQNACSVAMCADRAARRGDTVTDAALKPVYLRLPQAERERLERLATTKG